MHAYHGAGTFLVLAGGVFAIMDCPINTVGARMFPRLVRSSPHSEWEAWQRKNKPHLPRVLLLGLRCGSLTLSSLLITTIVTNLTFTPRSRPSADLGINRARRRVFAC